MPHVRKVWRQLKREGFDVARCTVSRLMRDMGLQGVIRGKPSNRDQRQGRAMPAGSRQPPVQGTRPNVLWLSDFTYVATWTRFVYVAFVIDALPAGSWAGGSRAHRTRRLCARRAGAGAA